MNEYIFRFSTFLGGGGGEQNKTKKNEKSFPSWLLYLQKIIYFFIEFPPTTIAPKYSIFIIKTMTKLYEIKFHLIFLGNLVNYYFSYFHSLPKTIKLLYNINQHHLKYITGNKVSDFHHKWAVKFGSISWTVYNLILSTKNKQTESTKARHFAANSGIWISYPTAYRAYLFIYLSIFIN